MMRSATLFTLTLRRPTLALPFLQQRLVSTRTVPAGAWDSHIHVTDPTLFPPASVATYIMRAAPAHKALANSRRLQLPNLVFVQPSTYGTDNSCLLDGLVKLGGRGVVAFDPKTTPLKTLQAWHCLGVRGARINLKSVNCTLSLGELVALVTRYADAIRPLQTWALQIYADLAVVAALEPLMGGGGLGVKLVIDHLGKPPAVRPDMASVPGWSALLRLLHRNPNAFVKLSAPYRVSKVGPEQEYADLEAVVKDLLDVRNGRAAVFASDWPHTRFEDAVGDARPWIRRCLEWCPDDWEVREDLFRRNAERLWDADSSYGTFADYRRIVTARNADVIAKALEASN